MTTCFNEEYYIEQLYREVDQVFREKLPRYDYELVFVDNGSHDRSYEYMLKIARKDTRVKIIQLSRNFKYEGGIIAGLSHAKGDAAVVLDCDLQDPVEMIHEFVEHYEKGNDVVYGIKRTRKEGFVKRMFYKLFYFLLYYSSEFKFPREAGEFCLMDRKIYTLIAHMKEQNKFIRVLRTWSGFQQMGVLYDRRRREFGVTKHSFRDAMRLALDGLFSFSNIPLRIIFWAGFFALLGSICLSIYSLIWRYLHPNEIPGYPALMLVIVFFGGLQTISLGIIGEYIYRIYTQTKERPTFIVKGLINTKSGKD